MLNEFLRPGTPPVVVPAPLSVNLSYIMFYQIRGRLYRLPSLLSEGFKAQMYIASLTPLSNHLCFTNNIVVFSNVMVWLGLSVCICFKTSDVVELCILYHKFFKSSLQ